MFISDERELALASEDVNTFDDWNGSTGHVAIVERDGVPHLTGEHDNENGSFSEYQFLVPLADGQDWGEALAKIDDIRLGRAKELFYFFPETVDRLRELAGELGLKLRED